MDKTCIQCHQAKPLDEFYRHSVMRDGHLNKCKECTKAYARRRYQENHETILEYNRRRNMKPHRVAARLEYIQTPNGKRVRAKACTSWASKYPERRTANLAVSNALRDGKLARLPCLICGSLKTEAHHPDYGRPLDVTWLCTTHHKAAHKLERKAA